MKILRGVFANSSGGVQLAVLVSLFLTGSLLSALIGLLAVPFNLDIHQDAGLLRAFQFISVILTFLIPSLLIAYLCSEKPLEYLSIERLPEMKATLLTFISMFLLSPFITLTGILNENMKFPAFMEPVEQWMREMEAAAEEVTGFLLSATDWMSVLMNLLVVAVAAAVTEEFLFRGALQRIIGKWTSNVHLIIWIAAFIFSAFHMQFYGFIPRLLLGAYFGYLLYWSRNLWLPVLAHFMNNAIAVIGMSNADLRENAYISGEIPESEIGYFAIPATISLILFFLCANYLRKSFEKTTV